MYLNDLIAPQDNAVQEAWNNQHKTSGLLSSRAA